MKAHPYGDQEASTKEGKMELYKWGTSVAKFQGLHLNQDLCFVVVVLMPFLRAVVSKL